MLWHGLAFSISAGVGFIALFVIAVHNGVVLVSYHLRLQEQGVTRATAAYEGAVTRLRPFDALHVPVPIRPANAVPRRAR